MLKLKRVVAVAMLMAVAVSANAQMRSENVLGTLVGGAVGAAAGNKVGNGTGRTVAIAAGTLLGAYVGDRMTSNQPVQQPARGYQSNGYAQGQAYPVRTSSQPIVTSRDAQASYDRNEVITDDNYERPAVRQPTRMVRQVRDVQEQPRQRFEKYFYTVQTESGRTIQMVGCAAYDEREGASRPVDLRNCESQQTAYQNY